MAKIKYNIPYEATEEDKEAFNTDILGKGLMMKDLQNSFPFKEENRRHYESIIGSMTIN